MRSRAFCLMCVVFVLLGMVSVGAISHIVPMMVDRGLSPSLAAKVAGLSGVAAIIGRGGIGWVLDRVHAPYILTAVALLASAAFLLLAYSTTPAASYLYTHDTAFYGSRAELYRGRDGVLAYFEALPLRFKHARFGEPALVLPVREVIVASGPVVFEVDEDGTPRVLPYRMTQVMIERSGSWLIATHHASAEPS